MGIVMTDVSKRYGDITVFTGVSLQFEYGSSTCLMGPSGYGKTTLLHILMGLIQPDSGIVSGVAGQRLAPVFQEDRLCENLSVGTNIRMASRERRSSQSIEDTLIELGLSGCLHQPVYELSSGMKRRIAIARALLSGGGLYIFDEPYRGLDADTKTKVMGFVSDRCRGKTMIWVTHDPLEAAQMGSRTICFPLGS